MYSWWDESYCVHYMSLHILDKNNIGGFYFDGFNPGSQATKFCQGVITGGPSSVQERTHHINYLELLTSCHSGSEVICLQPESNLDPSSSGQHYSNHLPEQSGRYPFTFITLLFLCVLHLLIQFILLIRLLRYLRNL